MPATPPPSVNELRRDAASGQQEGQRFGKTTDARSTVGPSDFYSVAGKTRWSVSDQASPPDSGSSRPETIGETTTRHILESFLCLAIAVIVFRSFVL